MEIYAPLADRMGMNRIRDELEDLFEILNTEARKLIQNRLKFIKSNRENNFKSISSELIEVLKSKGIVAKIAGRGKRLFQYGERFRIKKFH